MSSTKTNVKNINVSSSVLSRSERCEITKSVRLEKRSHGNFVAQVWKYFGELWHEYSAASTSASNSATNVSNVFLDKDHRYCLLCLQREQELYGTGQGRKGHISRIGKYSRNTSTCSLADHLFTVHDVDVRSTDNASGRNMLRQQSLKQSLAAAAGKDVPPAKSNFEFNRDLCLTVCTDLLPFNMVSATGFSKFFAKNFPDVKLPSQCTLSTTALYDLYRTLRTEVKNLLSDVADSMGCFSVMFDGWTDRYHARSFLGTRVAFIHPTSWETHVKTLSVKVVEMHTGQAQANRIKKELDDFGIGDATLFSTHDGAANVMK
jgi:hypothetical protein